MLSIILLGVDVSWECFLPQKILQLALLWCFVLRTLLFIFDVDLEFLDGKQNSVPNVWKVILTYVPIEYGVVDSYVKGFFY